MDNSIKLKTAKKKGALIFILCSLLIVILPAYSESHIYRIPVIVDTDMALDDIRALAMILNSDMFDIRLIVTSDGADSPETGSRNLRRILKYFERGDIKVAAGKTLNKPAPFWRKWSENLNWPDLPPISEDATAVPPAAEEIVKTLKLSDEKLIYLCIGPLTNLADSLKIDPGIKDKISRVIFFGGWNYEHDSLSADSVFKSGATVYAFSIPKEKLIPFNQELHRQIKLKDTPAARLLDGLHEDPTVKKLVSESHFNIWDEMTVIYLYQPSLFSFVPSPGNANQINLADFRADDLKQVYLELLSYLPDSHLSARETVILNDFPADPLLFKEDVRPYVKKIIERHGINEWKACLLTNELHRHLGIYSIIGAKMGIRAMEILGAPFDTFEVISLIGNNPPLSCMNDGLQVATGATIGRGSIKISDTEPRPAAIFLYNDHQLTLKLMKDIIEKIEADIETALKRYGGVNREYFTHIRQLSLDYWLNLERRKIFDEILE